MESVLKSLFKRELKAILAPYFDIICALFIIAIIGYIIYYLYNKFNENKTKNNVNSIVNNSLKCPNCGLEIAPEDRFCLKCGTALTQPSGHRGNESGVFSRRARLSDRSYPHKNKSHPHTFLPVPDEK